MDVHQQLTSALTKTISETNGISLTDTLELLLSSSLEQEFPEANRLAFEFQDLLNKFQINQVTINILLKHPFSKALSEFFKNFPLRYNEEHIHLTGAITADFIFPRLKVLLEGANKKIYEEKIREVYGDKALPINSVADVDRLIRLQENEGFSRYLKILYLPKLIFTSKQAHIDAAYFLAKDLFENYNVGKVRLKFSLSRASSSASEQIPGLEGLTSEDVLLGLYEGFKKFQGEYPVFDFVLSPSFRKEANHFDAQKFPNRQAHFMTQINEIVDLLDKYPYLVKHLTDADTVGDERDLYRKEHFNEMQAGFRKLQYRGFKIRSHHGETWHTLKKGIQAVDNAMNIWHIDTLEHGISLGINPNKYFHRIYQQITERNKSGLPILASDPLFRELAELEWGPNRTVLDKILTGQKLNDNEDVLFVKAKFHTAREVEHYQHDVLNRMIQKGVTLVSLPSSNNKLTGKFEDYKEHPFSWWEKKGVQLGVGTDNHVTLNTNFLNEMLILLYTDAINLKITKLLMVTTGENRRPYISHLLWKMNKQIRKQTT
jgi:adenosine deaminase